MSIRDVIERKFGSVTVSHGSNGTEYIVVCPHCGKRKLSINPEKGVYQCWHGCCSGGLKSLLGMNVRYEPVKEEPQKKARGFIEPGELVPISSLPGEHQARLYLSNRGFDTEDLCEKYGLMYCKAGKKFAGGIYDSTNTIVIPVWKNGELIGWQSRLLYNPDSIPEESKSLMGWKFEDGKYVKPPKYMTMPGFDRRTNMFNFDWARKGNLIVVTEGAFDAMAVGRCAVATFGKSITEEQEQSLKMFWDIAVLLLDPDAKEDQIRLTHRLRRNMLTVAVDLKGYKDAGEAPRDEIWRQIHESVNNDNMVLSSGKKLEDFKFII